MRTTLKRLREAQHARRERERERKLREDARMTWVIPDLWSRLDQQLANGAGWVLCFDPRSGSGMWFIGRTAVSMGHARFKTDEDARAFVETNADNGSQRHARAIQAMMWGNLTGHKP